MARQSLRINAGGYGRVPNSPSLSFTGPGTIMAMVYLEKYTAGSRIIFMKGSDISGAGWGAFLSIQASGKLDGANVWGSSQYNLASPSSIPLNKWVHVAFSWGGSSRRMYVDGVLVGTAGGAGALRHAQDSLIGCGQNLSTGQFTDGLLDEISLWNRQLSDVEVANFAHKKLDVSDPTIVGYWQFNNDTGSVAKDSTGKNNANLANFTMANNESLKWHKHLFQDGEEIKKYVGKNESGNLVPFMTSEVTNGVRVTASSTKYDSTWGNFYPWYLFDNVESDVKIWVPTTSENEWVKVDFGTPKRVTKYKMKSYKGSPKNWRFEGSDTGLFTGEEAVLHTVSDEPVFNSNETREYTFENSNAYQYYRIFIIDASGSLSIYDMELIEFDEAGWREIGVAPVTKEMYDLHGMSDLSVITNEVLHQLVSDQIKVLSWTDEKNEATSVSETRQATFQETVANGTILRDTINLGNYPHGITGIRGEG